MSFCLCFVWYFCNTVLNYPCISYYIIPIEMYGLISQSNKQLAKDRKSNSKSIASVVVVRDAHWSLFCISTNVSCPYVFEICYIGFFLTSEIISKFKFFDFKHAKEYFLSDNVYIYIYSFKLSSRHSATTFFLYYCGCRWCERISASTISISKRWEGTSCIARQITRSGLLLQRKFKYITLVIS